MAYRPHLTRGSGTNANRWVTHSHFAKKGKIKGKHVRERSFVGSWFLGKSNCIALYQFKNLDMFLGMEKGAAFILFHRKKKNQSRTPLNMVGCGTHSVVEPALLIVGHTIYKHFFV